MEIKDTLHKNTRRSLIYLLTVMVVLITMVATTEVTLLQNGEYKVTANMSIDSLNDYKSNVEFTFEFPSGIMSDGVRYAQTLCIDVGTADYTLTADTTGLPAFVFWMDCYTSCHVIDDIDTVHWFSGNSTYTQATNSFEWQKSSEILWDSKFYDYSSNNERGIGAQGLRDPELEEKNLPIRSASSFLRCFGSFDVESVADYENSVVSISGVNFVNENNVTLEGAIPGSAQNYGSSAGLEFSFLTLFSFITLGFTF